jgi:hypothetical protein
VTNHPALSAYVDELVETLVGKVELKPAYVITALEEVR